MRQSDSVDWRRDLDVSTVDVSRRAETSEEVRVPGLAILCHPDPRRVGEVAALPELPAGRTVGLSRLAPAFAAAGSNLRRPLADAHLSRRPAQLVPGRVAGSVRLVVGQVGQTVDIVGGRAPTPASAGDVVVTTAELDEGVVLQLGDRVALLMHLMDPTPDRPADDLGLVGESPAMAGLREALCRLARTDVPVLIRGETGTGKELAAAALHRLSARRRAPYVCVDMSAMPPSLAASELFGAGKGAFTGADRARAGFFQRADGGTLFLDEIGEAPPEVQASLLRTLETGEIQRIGSDQTHRVDVRVVAATDADLESKVGDGSFRAPLFHRLAGASVALPPLRRRRCDVARLLLHFLRQELSKCGAEERLTPAGKRDRPWLPAELVALLVARPWPGNVRQLRNVARQMVVHFHDRDEVAPDVETLGTWGTGAGGDASGAAAPSSAPRSAARSGPACSVVTGSRQPSQLSEDEVATALAAHDWRIQPAAKELGISRTSLYALIDEMPGLRRATQVERDEIEAAWEHNGGDLRAMVEQLKISRHGLQRRMRELGLP